MADLPSLSVPPPPTDRDDLPEYLDDLAVVLADAIASRLNRVVVRALRRFADSLPAQSLTATGDYAAFDSIATEWATILNGDIIPLVAEVHKAGAVTALVVASDKVPLPGDLVDGFLGLLDNNAVEYAAARVPDLVNIGQSVAADISERVANTIATGGTPEELKQQIERLAETSEYRADTIARTEVGIAWNTADYESARELGEFGPVEKVWRTTGDDRVRDSHAAMDGVRLPFDEPFNVDGSIMDYPQDPSGDVSEIVNCRCYLDEFYRGDTRDDGTVIGVDDAVVL